jgi:hypothetical protein
MADTPRPSPRLLITPRSTNAYLAKRRDPPPAHPIQGSEGHYVTDTGPLLNFAAVPERFALLKRRFGPRLHVPSRVAEELDRLRAHGRPEVRQAATEAMRQLGGGFPTVETLTNDEVNLAEGELLRHLLDLPPRLASQPSTGQNSGECHAAALAISRFEQSTTVMLTNDARALRLCFTRSVASRNLRGLLRELCARYPEEYTREQAWADYQIMTKVSTVANGQAASGPLDFAP